MDSVAQDNEQDEEVDMSGWLNEAVNVDSAPADHTALDDNDWLHSAARVESLDADADNTDFLLDACAPAATRASSSGDKDLEGKGDIAVEGPGEVTEKKMELEKVSAMVNDEFIPWVGMQLAGDRATKDLPTHHPFTRCLTDVLRQAQKSGRRHRALSAARIYSTALQDRQRKGIKEKVAELCDEIMMDEMGVDFLRLETARKGKMASINWRWDATTMFLRMREEQSRLRYRWCLRKM